MYVRGQFVQGMRYTTPGLSSWGTWSLGCTRSCCKVLIGRNVVQMPREGTESVPWSTRFILLLSCGLGGDEKKRYLFVWMGLFRFTVT